MSMLGSGMIIGGIPLFLWLRDRSLVTPPQ